MKVKSYVLVTIVLAMVTLVLIWVDALSLRGCVIFAIFALIATVWCELKSDKHRITYSTALLLYTTVTQLGLIVVYVFLGRESLSNYHDYTLKFLWSPHICRVVLWAVLAILVYEIAKQFARKKYSLYDIQYEKLTSSDSDRLKLFSTVLLMTVLIYFIYNILTGGMSLFSTYEQFRNSRISSTSLYSYILIIFYVGTIYLASAGTVKKCWLGWLIWMLQVILFAFNGNKGEFMYSLLAVIGMKGIQGKKITLKMLLGTGALLFIVIPSITSLRGIGVAQNLNQISFNPVEAFTEMGMQLRVSVRTIELIEDKSTSFLYGRSYWQPLLNIVTPFFSHSQATAHIRNILGGIGFSQVAESYLNFGVIGIMAFYGVVGYSLSKAEARVRDRYYLAYVGTITCILINVTRNYFAFVPGQVILVTVIYCIARRLTIKRGQ